MLLLTLASLIRLELVLAALSLPASTSSALPWDRTTDNSRPKNYYSSRKTHLIFAYSEVTAGKRQTKSEQKGSTTRHTDTILHILPGY